MSTPTFSTADRLAHFEAQGPVRSTPPAPKPARRVVERFSASHPRGSWPAEEFAQGLRRDGRTVDVVMDLPSDSFLVVEVA